MNAPIELVILAFSGEARAEDVLKSLKQLRSDDDFKLLNAAVLVKDRQGRTTISETADMGAGGGALFGAITGALIGLLGGPAGAIVGATAGAVTGAVTAHAVDVGFSSEQLKAFQDSLPPGSSAIITLVEHTWVEKAVEVFQRYQGKLLRQPVNEDLVSRVRGDERSTPAND
jgi:uncharacterized membrane protein